MATRDYLIGAVMGIALTGAFVIWRPFHKPSPMDHDITFSSYNFYDSKSTGNGDGMIQLNRSLETADENDSERPSNNTYTIQCLQSEMKCHVASAEQIGDNQVDEISFGDFAVTEWQPSEIIATDYEEGDTTSCAKNTITIERLSQKKILCVAARQCGTPCLRESRR